MRHVLLKSAATLAVLTLSACSEPATWLTEVETNALVTSAVEWTPEDITSDLPVYDATRERIEAAMGSFHESVMALRERHASGQALTGDAREEFLNRLHEDVVAIHTRHQALWESLTPEVKEILTRRFHEQMHGDQPGASMHERLRKLHGGDHGG